MRPLSLRLAKVIDVDYTKMTCNLMFHDYPGAMRQNVPLTQPYLGRGWGIYAGIEEGSLVIVGFQEQQLPVILASVYIPTFLNEILSTTESSGLLNYDEFPFRRVRPGDVVLQSKGNSVVFVSANGDIIIETVEGVGIEIDKETGTIAQRSLQRYIVSEGGRVITGMVKRPNEESTKESDKEIGVLNYKDMWGLTFDVDTKIIGQDPTKDFDPENNKALVEHRIEINEFADSLIEKQEYLTGRKTAEGFDDKKANIIATFVTGTLVNDDGEVLDLEGNGLTDPDDVTKKAVCLYLKLKSGWKVQVSKEGRTKISIPASEEGESLELTLDGNGKIIAPKIVLQVDEIHLGSEGGSPVIRDGDFPRHIDPVTGAPVTAFEYVTKSSKVFAD